MGSPFEVETGELRRGAAAAVAARDGIERARSDDIGHLGADASPGVWATVDAMRAAASSIGDQLTDLVADLDVWAESIMVAAARYDDADAAAARSLPR